MSDPLGFWEIAGRDPDRVAVIASDGGHVTYGNLLYTARRLANGFRAAGLKTGDVVSVLLPNAPLTLAVQLATSEIGMYFTAIAWNMKPNAIQRVVKVAGAKVLIAHKRFREGAIAAADELRLSEQLCFGVPGFPGFSDMEDFIAKQDTSAPCARTMGDKLLFTSGSTGVPKGVKRPIRPIAPEDALRHVLPSFIDTFHLEGSGGVHCVVGPLYHASPNTFAMRSLHIGSTLVFLECITPKGLLETIERYRVNVVKVVPAVFGWLLSLPAEVRDMYDTSSLTHVIHGAARCDLKIKRLMIEWLGPILHETYASTEVGTTHVNSFDWLKRPGTVGRPCRGTTVTILGEDGTRKLAGEVGLIYMRREGNEFEYVSQPEATAAIKRGDFATPGDVGFVDAEGWLYLCGRRDDVINIAGIKIYPSEVESVLLDHENVAEAVVIGVPDPLWGERIVALVEPTSTIQDLATLRADLLKRCRDNLPLYMRPSAIEYAQLIEPGIVKINRTACREKYLAGCQT